MGDLLKISIKFEVYSFTGFGDSFKRRPMPKIFTGTWPRSRLFLGKLFTDTEGFVQLKLCTEFVVSCFIGFGEMFQICSKCKGHVTKPTPRFRKIIFPNVTSSSAKTMAILPKMSSPELGKKSEKYQLRIWTLYFTLLPKQPCGADSCTLWVPTPA